MLLVGSTLTNKYSEFWLAHHSNVTFRELALYFLSLPVQTSQTPHLVEIDNLAVSFISASVPNLVQSGFALRAFDSNFAKPPKQI